MKRLSDLGVGIIWRGRTPVGIDTSELDERIGALGAAMEALAEAWRGLPKRIREHYGPVTVTLHPEPAEPDGLSDRFKAPPWAVLRRDELRALLKGDESCLTPPWTVDGLVAHLRFRMTPKHWSTLELAVAAVNLAEELLDENDRLQSRLAETAKERP